MLNRNKSIFLILFSIIMFVSCGGVDLSTEKAKYSYAIGYEMGSNIKGQKIDLDIDVLNFAVKECLLGKESRLSKEEIQSAVMKITEMMMKNQKKQGSANNAAGAEYLEKNKKNTGVKVTKSGLQYKVVKEGKGRRPKKTDTVKVHYRGTLIDGTEFDSSYKRKQPAVFPLDKVIPGWTEAIQLMRVGSRYELTIPGKLAYGERGTRNIPPNATLIFNVELLDIVKK